MAREKIYQEEEFPSPLMYFGITLNNLMWWLLVFAVFYFYWY